VRPAPMQNSFVYPPTPRHNQPPTAQTNTTNATGGKERILSDGAARDKFLAILDLHLLPPLPQTRAVWTTPFFQPGTQLPARAGVVEVVAVDGDSIGLKSAGATAQITRRDIYACKVRLRVGCLGGGCAWRVMGVACSLLVAACSYLSSPQASHPFSNATTSEAHQTTTIHPHRYTQGFINVLNGFLLPSAS